MKISQTKDIRTANSLTSIRHILDKKEISRARILIFYRFSTFRTELCSLLHFKTTFRAFYLFHRFSPSFSYSITLFS